MTYYYKQAGVLTDIRKTMAVPYRKWGLRALLATAGATAQAPMSPGHTTQDPIHVLERFGKLRAAQGAEKMRDRLYSLPDPLTKVGAVPMREKQIRRGMQALAGGHDFHGSGNLSGIVEAGGLASGTRNTFGKGVYYTQDRPAWEYWKDTFAHGPREGGLVVPREVSSSTPAKLFSPRPGAYRVGPDVPLQRGMSMVADVAKPSAQAALQQAQRNFRVRPLTMDALTEAYKRMQGGSLPVQAMPLYSRLLRAAPGGLPNRALGTLERAALAAKNLMF